MASGSVPPAQADGAGGDVLERLYEEQFTAMCRVAYLLTGNTTIAEDIVQDSFVRLHGRWSRVEHPVPYLRKAVVNACRQHHRRSLRERSHFSDLVTAEVSPETPVVLDALAQLPYRQRAALVLRYYLDRPEVEIAEALGCRPATVRSHVRRGLATLREVMSDER